MAPAFDGPNGRALDDTLAETGPGLPDDAVTPGELRPDDVDLAKVEVAELALRGRGWAAKSPPSDPDAASEADAEAESEAHPS